MRVLVTGYKGFIGSHLIASLRKLGHLTFGLDKDNCDLLNLPRLQIFIRKINPVLVFHLAASLPDAKEKSSRYFFKNNVEGTFNLLESLRAVNVRYFIYSSTMNVYGPVYYLPVNERHPTQPNNLYGLTKLLGERLCEYYAKNYKYKVIVLRYSGVYGPGRSSGAIASFISAALRENKLLVQGNGLDCWDALAIEDIVLANILALKFIPNTSFDVFNIGYGKPLNVLDVAKRIIKSTRSHSEITVTGKKSCVNFYYNIRKAKLKLGFRPRLFSEALSKFIEYELNK